MPRHFIEDFTSGRSVQGAKISAYASPSSSYRSKKNISRSTNTSEDRSADNTTNNNIKIEEKAPITTASI